MWRHRATGLGLIALAIGAIIVVFGFQYQDVYAKTMWHRFVKDSVPEVLSAEQDISNAQSTLRNAKEAQLDEPVVEKLENDLVAVTALFTELATLDLYIQPIEPDGTPIEVELSEVGVGEEDTSLASLDIFAEASSGTMYKVLDPPGVSGLLKRYEHVKEQMDALLLEVEVEAESVDEELSGHIKDAVAKMRAEAELLREAAVRASLFLSYVEWRSEGNELWGELEDEIETAAGLLQEVQDVDRQDLPAMLTLAKKMHKQTEAIDNAATALAESLGEVYEEVLETIPPEEIWEGGMDWLGDTTIAPIPEIPNTQGPAEPAGPPTRPTPPTRPGGEGEGNENSGGNTDVPGGDDGEGGDDGDDGEDHSEDH